MNSILRIENDILLLNTYLNSQIYKKYCNSLDLKLNYKNTVHIPPLSSEFPYQTNGDRSVATFTRRNKVLGYKNRTKDNESILDLLKVRHSAKSPEKYT